MFTATMRPANVPAVVALALGALSLPAALTFVGGVALGLAAVVAGFVGVARADRLAGSGQGLAVAAIIIGGLGMALGTAVLFLTAP
ncbi:MAG TPA: hypothetical protein VM307_03500 [Egibacteraceae bacterium]|nr:hypothetical protein [Egibacteraceae bacterium]